MAVSKTEVSFVMPKNIVSSLTEVVLIVADRVLVVGPSKLISQRITEVSHDKFTDFNLSGVIEISGGKLQRCEGKILYIWVDGVKFEVEKITG